MVVSHLDVCSELVFLFARSASARFGAGRAAPSTDADARRRHGRAVGARELRVSAIRDRRESRIESDRGVEM